MSAKVFLVSTDRVFREELPKLCDSLQYKVISKLRYDTPCMTYFIEVLSTAICWGCILGP